MELRQLAYFTAVAEELSFVRAAERLHVVPPAVSQQISRLERQLGIQLLDRTSRRVALTTAGSRFLPEARNVLASAERSRRIAADLAGEQLLRLGTSQGMGPRLAQVLEQLDAGAPELQVELVSAPVQQRLALVRSGELDATFVRSIGRAPELEMLPMWKETLIVALPAAHSLAGHPELSLRQLRDLPLRLVPAEEDRGFHDFLVDACEAAGFVPTLGPRFTNAQDTLAAIGVGRPSWTALYGVATEGLTVSRVAFRRLRGVTAQTFLAVPPDPPTRRARQLLEACTNVN